jgi:hypothetical protein
MARSFFTHIPNGLQSIHILVEDKANSQPQDMMVTLQKHGKCVCPILDHIAQRRSLSKRYGGPDRRTKGMTENITHEELESLYNSCNVSRAMKLLTGPDIRHILRKQEINLAFAIVIAKHYGNRLRHGWESTSNIKMDLRKEVGPV